LGLGLALGGFAEFLMTREARLIFVNSFSELQGDYQAPFGPAPLFTITGMAVHFLPLARHSSKDKSEFQVSPRNFPQIVLHSHHAEHGCMRLSQRLW